MWKYTDHNQMKRSYRHKRFFWIQPHARALLWTRERPVVDDDVTSRPINAKIVIVTGVRVVREENMLPPGLHGESLVVEGRGCCIRFTALTKESHDVWLMALCHVLGSWHHG